VKFSYNTGVFRLATSESMVAQRFKRR